MGKYSALGTVGAYYNKIASDIVVSAGNINMGVYDDTGSSVPNALIAQTGQITMPVAGYNYQSITEFQLTTTQAWHGMNYDSGSAQLRRSNNGETFYFKQPVASTVLTTPVSGFSTTTNPYLGKITYS